MITMKQFIPLTLLLCLVTPAAHAQTYAINWHKVAGGGAASTNAQYQLSGSIGQQDASPAMTGSPYSLTGGFWSLVALVQSAGAPGALHFAFGKHSDRLLAECFRLELAAEQQSKPAVRLVRQRRRNHCEWHKLSPTNLAHGKYVFPVGPIAIGF